MPVRVRPEVPKNAKHFLNIDCLESRICVAIQNAAAARADGSWGDMSFNIGFKYKVIKEFTQGENKFPLGKIFKCVNTGYALYDLAYVYTFSSSGESSTVQLWLSETYDTLYENFEELPFKSRFSK